ncbi:hypothetical protein TMatcc_003587 [Talaromyces marneffei ATCC 18224]|uniref:Karyogamy protein, KAR9 n=1 Tax=Talaromyces marneffei (strain ATCC 18224 / CBS 334.59 / QM 7333) TaxID=441960 RepID=B6Q3M0_TALMQ|nr:conserved hypothetical protein [Talaromyces marneffei ATCC 18224]
MDNNQKSGTLPFSVVAHLLNFNSRPSLSLQPPRHVDPDRYTLNLLNSKRRVYETVVDRLQSGPVKRGVVAGGRRSAPRVAAKSSSASLLSLPLLLTATETIPPNFHHVFSTATTAITATTASTNSNNQSIDKVNGSQISIVSMPAITFVPGSSATSTTTATGTNDNNLQASLRSLTKKFSAPQLSQPTSSSAGALDVQEPVTPAATTSIARRFKQSPQGEDNTSEQNLSSEDTQRTSIFRRLSPGLAARVKLLSGSTDPGNNGLGKNNKGAVGKIPEHHLRELENLHQDLSIKVEKRGRAWPGLTIKRERSAPDLLQSPTKKETSTGLEAQQRTFQQPLLTPDNESFPDRRRFSTADATEPLADARDSVDGVAASTMTTVEVSARADVPSSILQDVEPVQEGSTDLEEYLRRSTLEDQAPPPPPKDTPPVPTTPSSTNMQSYFTSPYKLNRAESIFSFSRASFSNQLSQLTSINLPQPAALEASITSIINAPTAVRALAGAAEQIEKWMNKASDVLNGLDAEDDVEWAAAGGREGLEEVDKAVVKFESLVDVYVKAIENVQLRDDIDDVRADDLKLIVVQMDTTLKNWASIRKFLRGVKEQVELAMEWEELWNNVLGDVGLEIDNLSRLIFEMEEKRHKSLVPNSEAEQGNGLDINELETIVEESPLNGTPSAATKRLSLALFPAADPSNAAGNSNPQDDANLMQLFARMQPLRASLDFLPMRLSMFQTRAEKLFPTACEELEDRRKRLETTYKKLEADAEALRRELGEDRWILVFRNAGKQAQKMCDSVERSIGKLQESLESGEAVNNPTALAKKVESYEAKKIHYVPAIARVMSIIQKGVNDRLTVNGEVLTLLSDMNQRVDALKASMKVMDTVLEETSISRGQQLRDSISSIITTDSPANTSHFGTPGSSPASSVIMTGYTGGLRTPNAGANGGSSRRGSSVGSTSRSAIASSRRLSGIPTAATGSRKSSAVLTVHSPPYSSTTPTPASRTSRIPTTPAINRPRWNASTNTADLDTGHNFKLTPPSTYRQNHLVSGRTSRSVSSSLPVPSPLSRATSSSPVPTGRAGSRVGYRANSRLDAMSPPTSPTLAARSFSAFTSSARPSVLDPPPYHKLRKSTANLPTGLRNRQSYGGPMTIKQPEEENRATNPTRPGTSLGHSGRRTSLLPPIKNRNGRESSAGQNKSKPDERPRWR